MWVYKMYSESMTNLLVYTEKGVFDTVTDIDILALLLLQ